MPFSPLLTLLVWPRTLHFSLFDNIPASTWSKKSFGSRNLLDAYIGKTKQIIETVNTFSKLYLQFSYNVYSRCWKNVCYGWVSLMGETLFHQARLTTTYLWTHGVGITYFWLKIINFIDPKEPCKIIFSFSLTCFNVFNLGSASSATAEWAA